MGALRTERSSVSVPSRRDSMPRNQVERQASHSARDDILAGLDCNARPRSARRRRSSPRRARRDDLIEQNAAERAVLARYLPRPLEDAELANLLRSWIAEGLNGMGPLMARLKDKYAGQYDGKRASEIVREILAQG